jgi:hypothetical protein
MEYNVKEVLVMIEAHTSRAIVPCINSNRRRISAGKLRTALLSFTAITLVGAGVAIGIAQEKATGQERGKSADSALVQQNKEGDRLRDSLKAELEKVRTVQDSLETREEELVRQVGGIEHAKEAIVEIVKFFGLVLVAAVGYMILEFCIRWIKDIPERRFDKEIQEGFKIKLEAIRRRDREEREQNAQKPDKSN